MVFLAGVLFWRAPKFIWRFKLDSICPCCLSRWGRLVSQEAAVCGVTPPVTFVACETSCAEQRGNFKSDHEGDLAACHHQNFKCILKPEQTCTVTLDTHPVKGKPQYQLKRKRLKQSKLGMFHCHWSSFVCKSLACAETHWVQHLVWLVFDIRSSLSVLNSSFFFVE